ncbi:MAG: hypothetical protein JGK17_13730 [Microcoleus sp. PH2017_10_PVI_O_A]|uniref:hypothetical protein n=1 Tax=unclassified Microcoleus TaxID=2642155 RepID=UPI001D1B2838|nr:MULTISPECIES: hypothetical protein [unclassified Microcoleus]MCC3406623.1 hypothetical protein [Microcoleus sp. PH2017_10_PVI_O_A]MCC3460635.1 hypothetical protein [Microcoleus sp. PH2017_11_PCY_U_A]MCC3479182.1 hypothetical protein [Microcoleus sp. PH2017_12_PCY_D_A]MCC3560023.1 hypothetical protein [Microcoleus sp. PH2017_27_LUM_O_A]
MKIESSDRSFTPNSQKARSPFSQPASPGGAQNRKNSSKGRSPLLTATYGRSTFPDKIS